MKYINYICDTLYNLTDICHIFNIKMDKIIKVIRKNNIDYFYDSKDNLYINSKNICRLFILLNTKETINSQEFSKFLFCVERNAFGEDQYDKVNKCILLNM